MIGVTAVRSKELLPLRIRLHGVGTVDEETERRDYQQGQQIHLTHQEICLKNRSHPFSLSHLDGRYTAFPNATPSGASYSGHVTEFTPDYTASIGLDKTQALYAGQLVLHADAHYQGNTFLDSSQNPQNFQSGYWLLDARVGYEFSAATADNKLGIYLYGKNLANKAYLVFARFASTTNEGLYGDPRFYGVEVTYRF